MLLKSAPNAVLPSGVIDSTKQFFILAFVPPEIRAAKNGPLVSLVRWMLNFRLTHRADVAADSVPPLWPPRPQQSLDSLTYELAIVPITSISLVTSLTMKVRLSLSRPCPR